MLYYIPTIIKKKKKLPKKENNNLQQQIKKTARDITSLTHDCVLSKHSVVVESVVVYGCW